jgi:hypothetical protein
MQLLCPASTVTRGNSNLLPLPSSLTLPWARPGATVPCPTPPGLGRARPRVPPPPPCVVNYSALAGGKSLDQH